MREFILSSEDLKDEKIWIVKLVYLTSLVETRVEGRRLISQGALTIDNERHLDINEEITVKDGMIVGIGKFLFCKVKLQ